MKRPKRKLREMADRTLLLRDRRPPPEPVTQPIRRVDPGLYQTAPAGPTRLPPQTGGEPAIRTHTAAYGEWTGTMTVNDEPASAAEHMDARCQAARAWNDLKAAYLEDEGMGYRLDDAARLRDRGEKLDGRSIIARSAREGAAHLLGPRPDWLTRNSEEPWEPAGGWVPDMAAAAPGGWARGLNWYRPEDGDTGLPWWRPEPQPAPVVDVAWPDTDPSGWRAAYERELGGDAA